MIALYISDNVDEILGMLEVLLPSLVAIIVALALTRKYWMNAGSVMEA